MWRRLSFIDNTAVAWSASEPLFLDLIRRSLFDADQVRNSRCAIGFDQTFTL